MEEKKYPFSYNIVINYLDSNQFSFLFYPDMAGYIEKWSNW